MDLLTRARAALRRGAMLRRSGARVTRVAQVLEFPSFARSLGYELFRLDSGGETEFVGVETCWESERDREKLRTPVERFRHPRVLEPTLATRSSVLPLESSLRLVTELEGLVVGVFPAEPLMGLDGTTHELVIGEGFARVSFQWWEEPPAAWSSLGEIADRIVALVRGTLDSGR